MTTDYKYMNDNYEKIENDMKASMYDIVMSEQEKTSAIIGKAQTTGNIKLQDTLIELCNGESECLHNLLEISNLFVENLQKLDSYSRELKKVEDKNIASIINGMRKKAKVERGNSPVTADEKLEEINKEQEEITKEQEELEEKEKAAQKLIEQVEQEQNSNSESEETVPEESNQEEVEQTENEQVESTPVDDGPIVKSVEVVEDEDNLEKNPDELAKTVGIDMQNGDLGNGVMTFDSMSAQGQSSDDNTGNADKSIELAKSLGINIPSNLGSGVITFNSTAKVNENGELEKEESTEPVEEKQEEVPEETSPQVIPQVIDTSNNENKQIEEEREQESPSPVIPVITDSPITEPEVKEEVEQNNSEKETNTEIEIPTNLKLFKNNFDEVRAILTSASQIEKLRLSRFSQEALLNSKNFFSNVTNNPTPTNTSGELVIPVANKETAEQVIPQTEQVIPQVSNGELVIPTATPQDQTNPTVGESTPVIIPGQTEQQPSLEQKLMDNNLLPNDINSLQAQIDQKMAQAKQLYDAGQTLEAQNIYNEISELSKNLQSQQGVAMAA